MLQLTGLLSLQVHQEKLYWGSQAQKVTLGMLVLKVFLVSEGSLDSLDILGVVISLDVMGQVEEVSPDHPSTKVNDFRAGLSGYFSKLRQRPLLILRALSVP